jgi:glycosyltransferase involved in cell wall biosynthesis
VTIALAIDASALSEGSEYRGIGTYLRNVMSGLAADDRINVSAMATRAIPLPAGVARLPLGPPGPPRVRVVRHDLRLPGLIKRSGCDVFHSPALLPPRRSPVPWVQTLHDLTPLVFSHPALARERKRWLSLGPRLRNAAAVICDSHSSARQGVELLGLNPARVHVAHLGVGAEFTPGPPAPDATTPYLLMVATWGPHKGFRQAVAALDAVAESGYPHQLLIAGYQTDTSRARIVEEIARSQFRDRIQVQDFVSDLAALYRGADVTLVPSQAEGFGLPALESMACGTPVIAADATSLPEVVGDAGVLVEPGNDRAWAGAVLNLLRDAPRHRDLGSRSVERASQFTWARTAHQYAEVISSLAST